MKLQFDFIQDSKQGVIELDVFTRILKGEIYDSEEVRKDFDGSYGIGAEYVGVALAGSSTSDEVWNCVKCTWINNHKTKLQFKANISWDSRISVFN